MAVLVLNGEMHQTPSIVRSLGRQGIPVDVVGPSRFSSAFYSKYCRHHYRIPWNDEDPDFFFNQILDILQKDRYELIIPQVEEECLLLSERKSELPYECLVLPPTESILLAADKGLTAALCKKLNIPVPETIMINHLDEIHEIMNKLEYPVLIKKRLPSYLRPVYVFKKESFIKNYLAAHAQTPYPIIQEIISGDGYGTFALCRNGKVLQYFSHRRVREQDPLGSGSSCCETTPLTPELKNYTDALAKALCWHGVVMFEFKFDRVQQQFKLLEINGRFWGSLPLAIHAGIDFPYQLYCLATHQPVQIRRSWENMRAEYFLGDLIRFLRIMKGKQKDFELDFPNRWQGIREVVKNLGRGKSFIFLTEDPLPFIMDIIDKFI